MKSCSSSGECSSSNTFSVPQPRMQQIYPIKKKQKDKTSRHALFPHLNQNLPFLLFKLQFSAMLFSKEISCDYHLNDNHRKKEEHETSADVEPLRPRVSSIQIYSPPKSNRPEDKNAGTLRHAHLIFSQVLIMQI